uniref:JmjC domain-containing histone demethylation protein 1 n=1 Tax=Kwoniella pini CBS 10737 TaxID=1296096 RepID=A0A1B9I4Q8_9TREE|nr:uncharacterized protein I206_03830 [Kwoniella pini CBS 10737]OCF50506.1 hypothetical protein I206_03830 [Kwoniella pini CBS 10737]
MSDHSLTGSATGNNQVSVDPEPEVCPLCPSTGPPQPSSDKSTNEVDLVWIACTKCATWYHSVCLLLAEDDVKATIPRSIFEEVEENRKDEGAWFNWTQWINKWYCLSCISKASDPANPRPPRYPLVATLKKGVPPFEAKVKRSVSSASLGQLPKQIKKARTSTPPIAEDWSPDPLQLESTHHNGHTENVNGEDYKAGLNDSAEGKTEGRPKRSVRQLDYNNLNNSVATPTNQWLDLIADPAKYGRVILDANYKSVPAKLLSRSWLDGATSDADYPPTLFYGQQREPIIIRPENGGFSGLGGQVPGKDLTVQDVAKLVGPKKMVDVIDVSSQQSSQWTLQKWADYLLPPPTPDTTPSSSRKKVYNIISLEISDTELAKKVKPPRIVREIDWVDNFWNFTPTGGKGKAYPKVQLYCLMGMKGAWTDWHVDFAASSVYYTIHTGSKVFYFIRPTTANLKAYAEWSGSYEKQQDTWLPDMCDEVRKVVLNAGDTMIIPAGYIHAVYTPMDSIVFGGNFLHSYDIDTQLRLRQIEIDTKVPQRFRFPMVERLCWFVADRYTAQLRQHQAYKPRATTSLTRPLHNRVLSQLVHLTNFLLNQISILHNPEKEERSKKLVWDRIPHEIVRDPEGLIRELQWRIRKELGLDINTALTLDSKVNGHNLEHGDSQQNKESEKETKRKKAKLGKIFDKKGASRTWMFDRPKWEEAITNPQIEISTIKIPRPISLSAKTEEGHANEENEEEAERTISTIKQLRMRTREVQGGAIVKEEQEVIFIEKRIVWGLHDVKAEEMEVDEKA